MRGECERHRRERHVLAPSLPDQQGAGAGRTDHAVGTVRPTTGSTGPPITRPYSNFRRATTATDDDPALDEGDAVQVRAEPSFPRVHARVHPGLELLHAGVEVLRGEELAGGIGDELDDPLGLALAVALSAELADRFVRCRR